MGMLLKLENPTLLARIIEIISELVAEVRIKVDENGMSIVARDPSNFSMVSFKLPKNSFSQFETDKEVLGINLENLKRILKRCGPRSSLVLERKENLLHIHISDRIKRTFKLSLIDVESEDREMPTLEFSSRVEINSIDLIDSIEDCAVVSDSCAFAVRDGKFIVEAKGLDSASSEFSAEEVKMTAENCKAKYSIGYLQKFIKGAKLCDKTVLNFAEEHPLKIELRTENMELDFLLAPRVETED